jgi:hypothetical protein
MSSKAPSTAHTCDSYLPGHQLHWSLWKQASTASQVPVLSVAVRGTTLVIETPEGTLRWSHHAPAKVSFALEHAEHQVLVAPDQRALRIDGYWFNCAPEDAELSACS